MKNIRNILISVGLVLVLPMAAHAAVSATQTWSFDNGYLKNSSNGQTLCVTTSYYLDKTVMEKCESQLHNQQFTYMGMNGFLRLMHDRSLALTVMYEHEVTLAEASEPMWIKAWYFNNGKVEIAGENRCMDIHGGKNVEGAQVIVASCTK